MTQAKLSFSQQSLPDKEGKKCLLYIKCSEKSFEISVSDKKKKQEWIQGKTTVMFPSTAFTYFKCIREKMVKESANLHVSVRCYM